MKTFSEQVNERRRIDAELLLSSSESVYHSFGRLSDVSATSYPCRTALELSRICSCLKVTAPQFPDGM